MAQWRFLADEEASTIQNGGQQFGCFATQGNAAGDAESTPQIKIYRSYTFSDIRGECSAFSGANLNLVLRDDGVSSSNLIAVFSASGWAEDLTGSDAPASGSLMNYLWDHSAGMHGDQFQAESSMITYEHASVNAPMWLARAGNKSATAYFGVRNSSSSTEANAQTRLKRATVLSNLFSSNSSMTGTWTGVVRKNGVSSTNLTLSFSSGADVEDITGSESYAAGDDFAFLFNEDTAGDLNDGILNVDADTESDIWCGFGLSTTTRNYQSFAGQSLGQSASPDDNWLARLGSVTAANWQSYVTGAGSGTRDLTLRVGTTNSTNLTIAITATGYVEDTTGSEAVADGDSVTATEASTGTTVTTARTVIELPWVAAAAASIIPKIMHHRSKNIFAS